MRDDLCTIPGAVRRPANSVADVPLPADAVVARPGAHGAAARGRLWGDDAVGQPGGEVGPVGLRAGAHLGPQAGLPAAGGVPLLRTADAAGGAVGGRAPAPGAGRAGEE